MRIFVLSTLSAMTVACTTTDADLVYRGTLDVSTKGVALFEDGQTGHAGMLGTTCAIQTNGAIEADVDLDGSDDQVFDGSRSDDGSVVLARSGDRIHLIEGRNNSWGGIGMISASHSASISGATAGAVTSSGFMLWGDCTLSLTDRSLNVVDSVSVPVNDCDGAFAADKASSMAFVAGGNELAFISGGSVDFIAERGDLVAFSPAADAVLVAEHGSNEVRALEIDGSLRWSVSLPGTAHAIADLGNRNAFGVMTVTGSNARFVLLDGDTGAEINDFSLPGPATLSTSADGRTLAMVLDQSVHYYNLR